MIEFGKRKYKNILILALIIGIVICMRQRTKEHNELRDVNIIKIRKNLRRIILGGLNVKEFGIVTYQGNAVVWIWKLIAILIMSIKSL